MTEHTVYGVLLGLLGLDLVWAWVRIRQHTQEIGRLGRRLSKLERR